MEKHIKKRLEKSAYVKLNMAYDDECIQGVEGIAKEIIKTYKGRGKVVLFGNGGSASDAQHIAAEFVGRYEMERPGLEAIALTTDTSILTAVGNDYGFDAIFERQVEAYVKSGDFAIGITTSGNSVNVLKGLLKATGLGAKTAAFTGSKGLYNNFMFGDSMITSEKDRALCEKLTADYVIKVPHYRTSIIQEAHITIGHTICGLVEKELF